MPELNIQNAKALMPMTRPPIEKPLRFFLHHVPSIRGARHFLQKVIRRTLRQERLSGPGELHIVFVTDRQIRRLNRLYHHADRATDVLAFSYFSRNTNLEPRTTNSPWADVYVSIDRARIQGPCYGHTVLEELAFLAVHGILHAVGYRDATPRECAQMLARQKELIFLKKKKS